MLLLDEDPDPYQGDDSARQGGGEAPPGEVRGARRAWEHAQHVAHLGGRHSTSAHCTLVRRSRTSGRISSFSTRIAVRPRPENPNFLIGLATNLFHQQKCDMGPCLRRGAMMQRCCSSG